MPWIPSESLLGTVTEFENFSYSIQYYTPGTAADPEAIPPVEAGADIYYDVNIVPQQTYSTVTTTNGSSASVAGFFQYVFNDVIQQKNKDGTISTITGDATTGAWAKIDLDNVYEMTSFKADSTRDKTVTYTANAMDGSTVLDTQTFTIRIFDPSWTTGKNNLKNAVSLTTARNVK